MQEHTPVANTIPTACNRLGIGRTLLYDLLKQGKLKSIKLGNRTLIPESELQRLIAEQLTEG
jgi:excisionase family DNA binding protein